MLRKATAEDISRYAPWAYTMAMTAEHASYPTWRDGLKTREDFMQRAQRGLEDEEVLLFCRDGEVCGWIQWFAMPEENYAMTVTFLVENHAADAAREFAAHAAQRLSGAVLDIGLDGANTQAAAALKLVGFTLLESSVNHTMHFAHDQPRPWPQGVARMTAADEADFRRLHNWPDMYWNAERILADLSGWRVYLHREAGESVAALVCRAGEWPEVFSVDFGGKAFRPESYRRLMTACLNDIHADGRSHMTYFEEEEQALPILAELGFDRVGRYAAYRKELKEE